MRGAAGPEVSLGAGVSVGLGDLLGRARGLGRLGRLGRLDRGQLLGIDHAGRRGPRCLHGAVVPDPARGGGLVGRDPVVDGTGGDRGPSRHERATDLGPVLAGDPDAAAAAVVEAVLPGHVDERHVGVQTVERAEVDVGLGGVRTAGVLEPEDRGAVSGDHRLDAGQPQRRALASAGQRRVTGLAVDVRAGVGERDGLGVEVDRIVRPVVDLEELEVVGAGVVAVDLGDEQVARGHWVLRRGRRRLGFGGVGDVQATDDDRHGEAGGDEHAQGALASRHGSTLSSGTCRL